MRHGARDSAIATDGQGAGLDLGGPIELVSASLRAQAAERIRREIAQARLLPGQRLLERELVESLGVSRTTIREALRELVAEGLVTMVPHRGAHVVAPSAKEAAEIYGVRAVLEGLLAREFAEHASERHLEQLRAALTAVKAVDPADPQALLSAKNAFYAVLFAGAQNATVSSILNGLQVRISLLRATSLAVPGRIAESIVELQSVVTAIERRDPSGAEAAATTHVNHAARAALCRLTTPAEEPRKT
jgi:DNA-binding GntR family transcriptional regulator